jgi:hypothetical protein
MSLFKSLQRYVQYVLNLLSNLCVHHICAKPDDQLVNYKEIIYGNNFGKKYAPH